MATKVALWQNFSGGWATDVKYGIKGSAALIQAFDFRSSPSALSVLPSASREDPGILRGLPLAEVMDNNGVIYMQDDSGFIYRRSITGAWSDFGAATSGCAGMDYRFDTDSIYVTSNKTVSAITGVVNGTPTLVPDKYASSISTYNNSAVVGFNVNADQEGSSLTYTLGTAINELSTNLRYFQTDIDPLNQIAVFVVARGTGDWTLTLHDGTNTVLGTATIANASLNNGAFNNFVFSNAPNGQVRVYPAPNARTYHIHVTSTVADGTLSTSSANDMANADLQVYADRLVYPANGWHPMTRFLQYEIIGNGNYISAWEPITDPPTNSEWVRAQLTLPMEYTCTGVDHTNEFLVAAFERTSSNGTPQEGLIIFWDGVSATYNYDVPIREGSPLGLHVYENVVYYFASNSLYAMTSPTTQPIHLRTMPGTDESLATAANTSFRPFPNSMTTRQGIQLMGWPGVTSSFTVSNGVWSWGAIDKNYPSALGYNYIISTGHQTNIHSARAVEIGLVKNFGSLLHIGWKDSSVTGVFGIDKVDATTPTASVAIWQSVIVDNGYAAKYKTAKYCEVYYALQDASQTITLAYQINRSGTWVTDPNSYTTTNLWQGHSGYARFDMATATDGGEGGRFREVQMQITITNPNGVLTTPPPQAFMAAIVYDDGREELVG